MTRNKDAASPPAAHVLRFALHVPGYALATALSLVLSLDSAPASTPYQPIVERNVFGLKPPPPPPDPETLKPPPSKLTLTGIMTIFGKKQALLKAPPSPAPPPKPGQPAEPPKEHSYMLAEGQGEDGITILQIDTVGKSVKVDNSGHIETLTFSTNAPMGTASAGPSPMGVPSPTGLGNGMPQPNFPRTIPRPLRIPTPGASSSAAPYGQNSANGGVGATGEPSASGIGYGAVATQSAEQSTDSGQSVPHRTLEENVALAEINATRNEQLRAAGVRIPPIPHHPLAAGMYGDSSGGQMPQPAPQ